MLAGNQLEGLEVDHSARRRIFMCTGSDYDIHLNRPTASLSYLRFHARDYAPIAESRLDLDLAEAGARRCRWPKRDFTPRVA